MTEFLLMKSKRFEREIDIADTMQRNQMTREQVWRMLEAAELSGQAYSRVSPDRRRTSWFLRE